MKRTIYSLFFFIIFQSNLFALSIKDFDFLNSIKSIDFGYASFHQSSWYKDSIDKTYWNFSKQQYEKTDFQLNEINPGVSINFLNNYFVGYIKNSFYNNSFFLGKKFNLFKYNDFQLNAKIFGITGYDKPIPLKYNNGIEDVVYYRNPTYDSPILPGVSLELNYKNIIVNILPLHKKILKLEESTLLFGFKVPLN